MAELKCCIFVLNAETVTDLIYLTAVKGDRQAWDVAVRSR